MWRQFSPAIAAGGDQRHTLTVCGVDQRIGLFKRQSENCLYHTIGELGMLTHTNGTHRLTGPPALELVTDFVMALGENGFEPRQHFLAPTIALVDRHQLGKETLMLRQYRKAGNGEVAEIVAGRPAQLLFVRLDLRAGGEQFGQRVAAGLVAHALPSRATRCSS